MKKAFHLSLGVNDIEKSINFFEGLLKARVTHRNKSGYVNIELFGSQITLKNNENIKPDLPDFHFGFNLNIDEFERLSMNIMKEGKDTVEMGRRVGLKSCFTKAYTPQSNGMSESFVGTMKRDYVYTSDCVDAKATLKMISGWFKDYNEVAPHSGLGMMSPLEYKKVN